ncbi:hypothetical protein F0562_013656 [Nyssa sinensis]|uniref:Cell division cycle protein 123 homolog n=1 Tax=Nyssa sinensis TaxID=561372 RepID=A0A5J4ZLA3_9ASTE|nr:hypothetical protein F0562_013656 [Nyssa sinensis]
MAGTTIRSDSTSRELPINPLIFKNYVNRPDQLDYQRTGHKPPFFDQLRIDGSSGCQGRLTTQFVEGSYCFVTVKEHSYPFQEKMQEEEVNRCQIQEWYPKFKSISIKTLIHELPESFIQYLLDDSGPFLLPLSISNEDALPNRVRKPEEEEDYVVSEGSGDESEQPSPPPSFPELELKIKESIECLGGAVFPKLNWSAPKDSAWISSTGTLCCTSFSEIALLLRSSDSLIHDLCHAYDSCSDKTRSRPSNFFLALRKWYPSLRPEMEFRCFVQGQLLIGISQREVTGFYPVLIEKKNDLEMVSWSRCLRILISQFEVVVQCEETNSGYM